MKNDKLKQWLVILSFGCVLIFGCVGSFLYPDQKISDTERRPLTQFQKPTKDTIINGSFMKNFEDYSVDQFPVRDGFRQLKACTALSLFRQQDVNDLYMVDGFVSKMDAQINEDSFNYATDRFSLVYDTYLKDKKMDIYSVLIPDKNQFMAKKSGHLALDFDALKAMWEEKMSFAQNIPIENLLSLDDFYQTDIHWRQEKIGDISKKIADTMGITLKNTYELKNAEVPFNGVYAGQLAIKMPADDFYYVQSEVFDYCQVYDYETKQYLPVYDEAALLGKDAYSFFLHGSKSLLTIENPTCENDQELIVFRDSFGSSIAPYWIEGYKKITLVDIRYIMPKMLGNFIEFKDQDVLFMYSTDVINHSEMLK